MINLSTVTNASTANTHKEVAQQRARNIQASHVLELCVGPSLCTLEEAYREQGIIVTGNDIDPRWKQHYPQGRWKIGDALKIDYSVYDGIVFAPPLSYGCTGKRSDSLSIEQVTPSYYDFLDKIQNDHYHGEVVLVLPARSLSTRKDRRQYFKLIDHIYQFTYNMAICHMKVGKRQTRKYVDIYFRV